MLDSEIINNIDCTSNKIIGNFYLKELEKFPRNGMDFTTLCEYLKSENETCRKEATVLLGQILRPWALTFLLDVCLFDKSDGVRLLAISSIIEIARKSQKSMIKVQKKALHPIFNSWQHYPTVRYLRAVHWALSCFTYRKNDAENIIKIITRKQKIVIETAIAIEMDAIINTVTVLGGI